MRPFAASPAVEGAFVFTPGQTAHKYGVFTVLPSPVAGGLQVGAGGCIRKGIIIHVLRPFIGGYHVSDIIMTRSVPFHAAGPEIGCFFKDRVAFFP